jgi:hypothetical protein
MLWVVIRPFGVAILCALPAEDRPDGTNLTTGTCYVKPFIGVPGNLL